MRLARVAGVHERHEHRAELLEIDRLRHVTCTKSSSQHTFFSRRNPHGRAKKGWRIRTIEPGLNALLIHIPKHVCTEGNNRQMASTLLALPLSNLFTRLIAVFIRHVQIAEDDAVVARRRGEDLFRALDAVDGRVGGDADFGEEFEDDL